MDLNSRDPPAFETAQSFALEIDSLELVRPARSGLYIGAAVRDIKSRKEMTMGEA